MFWLELSVFPLTKAVAAPSLLIGLCNLVLGKDPIHDDPSGRKAPKVSGGMLGMLKQIWCMCQIPTFALIIVQVTFTSCNVTVQCWMDIM